jgi:hypothetical protein
VEEAAKFINNCFTETYKTGCLEHWKKLHGEQYVAAITRLLKKPKK